MPLQQVDASSEGRPSRPAPVPLPEQATCEAQPQQEPWQGEGEVLSKNLQLNWSLVLSPSTLRFANSEANQLFYEQQVVGTLAQQDRVLVGVGLFLITLICLRVDAWDKHLVSCTSPAVLLLFVLQTLVSTMSNPALKRLYIEYRSALVLACRLLILLAGYMAYQRSSSLGRPQELSLKRPASRAGSFLVLLLLTSRVLSLSILAVGAVLPFWLHLLLQPVLLLFLLGSSTVSSVSSSLCRCCFREVSAAHHWLSRAAMVTQPMQWVFLSSAQELLEDSTCATCPAPQLVLFVQVSLGLVIPSVVLYRLELDARMRFVAANAGRWGFPSGGLEPLWLGKSSWLLVLVDAGQVLMGLAGLWQLLDYAFS